MVRAWLWAGLILASAVGGCARTGAGAADTKGHVAQAGPARRPGLWEQTLVRDGHRQGHGPMKICVDARSESRPWLFAEGRAARDCQRTFTRTAEGTWRFVSTCRLAQGATLTSSGVARGDFLSHYEVRSTLAVSGAPLAELDGTREVDLVGSYRGPCPTGMAPGEIRLGGGLKLSARRLPRAAAAFVGV
jgi:hypothetical protein